MAGASHSLLRRLGVCAGLTAIILMIAAPPTSGAQTIDASSFPTLKQAITGTCTAAASAVAAPADDCGAIKTAVIGQANGTTLHFARYCLDDIVKHVGDFCILQGMAVLAQSSKSGQTTRLFETSSDTDETYQAPALVDSPYGKILDIAITIAGTGHFNRSVYLLLKDGQWQKLDNSSWLNDLQSRIPNGTEVHKGIWPNLITMQAHTDLYKPEDPDCCPTAGTVDIKLELVGTRLTIKSLTVGPPPKS
ncbi:MAG: hypothetical protein L0H54_07590 [Alcaligenaceae bacterium]|nr:hypothetical protein [Alcaligenaceae bacterium]